MPAETVKVIVRVRPMNQKERDENSASCVVADEKMNQIVLTKASENDSKAFTFDYVFTPETAQQSIYEKTAFPLVENVVEGYNGTIFAYGQTGCGKTFTMIGDPKSDKNKGIIVRTFDHIINIINSTSDKKFLVRCSYIEIYNEEIHDLLGKDVKARMELKESPDKGVFIKDLTINVVKSVAEMEKYMQIGTDNRSVGATAMNKDSSRSHCLFTIYVECQTNDDKGQERITAGKLNLVDLAGSERQSKTQATGDRLKEATKINLSLSALGNVISALVDGKTAHIPYRDSKLTRLLQDSLGGNTKTLMIAAVSPADFNYEETLSTLRYASRAKLIKNQPKVNQDPKDALLLEYAEEIKKLKALLLKQTEDGTSQNNNSQNNNSQNNNNRQTQQNDTQQALQEIQKQNSSSHHQINPMTQSKILELENLRNENDLLAKERQKYELDLQEKEAMAQREREEREKLEQLIKAKEQQLMQGGKGNEEEKKKFRQLQNQINKQKKDHEQLLNEKAKQEEEMLKINQQYQSLQDEVIELRKKVLFFKNKYEQSEKELKDVQKENEGNREDLLETIRTQERELKLHSAITMMMLTSDQFETIKGASEWNENNGEYKIPAFQLKNKQLKFPSLPHQQAIEFVNSEKEGQELYFGTQYEEDQEMKNNQFRIKNNLNPNGKQMNKKAQPNRDNQGMMTVNKVLSQSNSEQGMLVVEKQRQTIFQMNQNQNSNSNSLQLPPQKEAYDKKFTKVQLDPITEDINLIDYRQVNASVDYNSQATQKPTKNKQLLQPVDKPPMPVFSQQNISTPLPSSEYKRPGRQLKLDKIN